MPSSYKVTPTHKSKGATKSESRDNLSSSNQEGDKEDEEKKKELPPVSFGKLFRYTTCCDVLILLLGTFFALVHGGGWPALTVVFGQMTDEFISVNTTGNQTMPDFSKNMTEYALYFMYIALAVFVAAYAHSVCWLFVCERQCHRMRKAFYQAILRQEIAWFDKHSSGELATRLADDLERIREGVGDKFGVCIQWFSAFFAGFAIGFWKSWKLTLVMMSITPVLAGCAAFMAYTISKIAKDEQTAYAGAGTVAEEVLSCIRTVVSFCGQKKEVTRYEEAVTTTRSLGVRKALVTGFGMGFFMLALFSAYGLAFWFGSTLVLEWQASGMVDGLSPGNVFTVFFAVMIGSFSIGNAAPHFSVVATAKGAAAFIYDVVDRVPEIDASNTGGTIPPECDGQIELKNVDFFYPTRPDVQILKDYSITVEPGKTVALVGSSGCGKSTVINLIQRFYDPAQGKVMVDGVDIRDLNLGWLRDQIGIVSQEPILFGCSIEDNIAYGRAGVTQEEMIAASRSANAHDYISQLPEGYKTLVGDRGIQLSGGQKQRVAIARALVRNPRILLLDEATSALDSGTEKMVQDALDHARQGRTTIIVAHRLSTIKNADLIYAVDQGKIAEMGTHEELMAEQGVYYQLVTLQTFVSDDDKEKEEIHSPDENGTSHHTPLKRSQSVDKKKTSHSKKKKTGPKDPEKGETEDEEEEEKEEKKESFGRMMKMNSPEWPLVLMGCLSSILLGAAMPVFAVFFSKIIEVFAKTGDELKNDAIFWSLMFVALGAIQMISQFGYISFFGISGERLTMRLRVMSFKSILRQDVGFFDKKENSTGALTTRLATDATMVKSGAGIRLGVIIQSVVSLLAGLIIALIYGWKLALAVLAVTPLMAAAGAVHMKSLQTTQKRDSKLLEEAGETATESIEHIRTVQSLGLETRMYTRYCSLLQQPYKENICQAFVFALSFGFSQAIIFLIYGGAFRLGAYLVEIDDMTPENVYRVFFAIAFSGMAVGQASSLLPDFAKAQLGAGYIYKILDAIPTIDSYSTDGQKPSALEGEIKFEHVEFIYPSRPNINVLQGVNLHVNPGTTLALVGASGCGKSTMVSLLQRFYDPISGSISIDGIDVKSLNPTWLRNNISVVSQEPILFDTSIASNIAYGIDGDYSMNDVTSSAKLANIHDFIMSLPEDYSTRVGEKGTQLSGGQKQRIAIARALITNPKILLLDEATSALDTESEKVVQNALDQARKGRTCVVIAHRLSTVQSADQIAVVEQGKIVEIGTHQQLLQAKGAYFQLTSGQRNILT